MRVGRRYTFRARHSLPDMPAPWCHPHIHTYTVEVEGDGDPPYAVNMEEWDKVSMAFVAWEGADLNESVSPSTVENLAAYLLKDFPNATAVTVWEDDNRWARAER